MQRTDTMAVFEESEKVEIFMSCRNLKNMDTFSLSDPQIRVYIEKNGKYVQYGETEVIDDNLNPDFSRTIIIDFHFETKQKLRFEVVDIDGPNKTDFIGEVFTTLGELVGAKNQTSILAIKDRGKVNGKLIIRCEAVKCSNDIVKMQPVCKNLKNVEGCFFGLIGSNNAFLSFYRFREDGASVKVYETDVVNSSNHPSFKKFDIKVQKLCNGDLYRPIRVECKSRSSGYKNLYIGEFQFSLNELLNNESKSKDFILQDPKTKAKTGVVSLNHFEFIPRPTFLDYLRGGVQLNVIVAIDFTGSNGDPIAPDSLHSIKYDGTLNEYQKAIMGVCEILLNYDHDKRIPVYGFGAKPQFPKLNSNVVSHCFPVNADPVNPYVFGLDGIMKVYAESLRYLNFSGPTLFAPLIGEAMKISSINKAQGSMEYTILLIITDGEIHDMQETINCLIKSARLPLSIIIVGVGKADFTNMEILDGDEGLQNSEGVKAGRDLVQFVPFSKYQMNHEMLASAVLEEIPDQLIEYMTFERISPLPPIQVDRKNLLLNDYGSMNSAPDEVIQSRQNMMENAKLDNNTYRSQQNYQNLPSINPRIIVDLHTSPSLNSMTMRNFRQQFIEKNKICLYLILY